MKEDLSKPLYADCKKQKGYKYFWSDPVKSRERIYGLADRRLLVIGWILNIAAIGVIGWLNPYWRYRSFETVIICLILIIIAEFFYTRKFVYRFGRFRVTELHTDEQASSRSDKDGEFLKTEENRKAAKKSRRAFLVLFAGIIAVVLLYCFIWIGLSYTCIPSWHKGEIEEAWQIAQKYDYVQMGVYWGDCDPTEDISQQDRHRLWEICSSLRWEYVRYISMHSESGSIEMHIDTIFGCSKLLWYEDNTDISRVKRSIGADTVVQLDEHWFYVRKDDAKYWW